MEESCRQGSERQSPVEEELGGPTPEGQGVEGLLQLGAQMLPSAFVSAAKVPYEQACAQASPEWKTHLCWFSCGGRCVNRSLVDDGVVLRQSSDNLHPDSPDYPQQRGCARGRTMRHAVFGVERLKYPLKRRHWKPGGMDHHPELRGRDEWVRITWDEALDLAARELTRIKDEYGSKSILCTGYEMRTVLDQMYQAPALNAYGGCTFTWGQASQGAFPVVSNLMKGSFNLGRMDYSDRFALREADLVVMWGQNPAWSMLGNVTYDYLQAKRAGARFVFVDPFCNPSMQPLADEWVPVRPGTDTALMLAIAYHMIENDLQDQVLLDRCCVGFDAQHMPADAPSDQRNFRDYVMGVYDGIPKTPEWASPICGTPVDAIKRLACAMGESERVTLRASQAPARTENGETFAQAFYTIGWMAGAVGKPGAETSAGAGGYVGFGGDLIVKPGPKDLNFPVNPICEPPRGGGKIAQGHYDPDKYYGIAMAEMWSAVETGEYTDFCHGKQPLDIRALFKVGEGARMNQNPDFMQAVRAFRSVDFVLSSDIWMTNDCKYADIVLPSTSFWETAGLVQPKTNREFILCSEQICQPLFECREDLQTEGELARRWGIDPKVVNPMPLEELAEHELRGAQVRNPETGDFEQLIDFGDEHDADATPVSNEDRPSGVSAESAPNAHRRGRISLHEFRQRGGVYQVERTPGDLFVHYRYGDFVADPESHPLSTASGKFEISCASLVECYARMGLSHVAEIAQYRPAKEGFEQTRAEAEFPLQSISLHHPAHAHQAYGSVATLGALFPTDVAVNPIDAEEAGIEDGRDVLVESPFGAVVRTAHVTRLIMPGVIAIGEGAWSDIKEVPEAGASVDMGGNSNSVQASALVGEGQCTWNSNRARLVALHDGVPAGESALGLSKQASAVSIG